MEPEDTPTTEFEFITHEPVEPAPAEEPEYKSMTAAERGYSTFSGRLTGSDMVAIYTMLKSIRKGEWGEGEEVFENLEAIGLSENEVYAVREALARS